MKTERGKKRDIVKLRTNESANCLGEKEAKLPWNFQEKCQYCFSEKDEGQCTGFLRITLIKHLRNIMIF